MLTKITGFTSLSKSIIQIKGPDASKFLNGIITTRLSPSITKKKSHTVDKNRNVDIDPQSNWGLFHQDIYDPSEEMYVRRDGLYTMLLNSKGRVNTDLFLYAYPYVDNGTHNEANYLVEVDPAYKSKLLTLLKLHKLSSRVEISPTDIHSYYYYNDDFQFDDWLASVAQKYMATHDPASAREQAQKLASHIFSPTGLSKVVGFAVDNRIPNFGLKILTSTPLESPRDIFSDSFEFDLNVVNEDTYTDRRYLNGLFEVSDAPGASLLPFECNLDYVNGLSLEKGCYVGQELTIRTFNNGVIRKRIMPFQFFDPDQAPPDHMTVQTESTWNNLKGEDIWGAPQESSSPFGSRRQRASGRVLSVRGNVGFVSVNVEEVERNGGVFRVGGVALRVFRPEWWPEE